MVVCSDPKTEMWSPDFSSSGLQNPLWARIKFSNTTVVNSLEWTEWERNPVQVILCDACGTSGCAAGGYVHVSRLEDFVLLTAPQIADDDDWATSQYAPHHALEELGAIAIPNMVWDKWRSAFSSLPAQSAFSEATGRALADAWALGPGRPKRIERLMAMLRRRTIACDILAPEVAVSRVRYWLDYLLTFADGPPPAKLMTPSEVGARLETLYFDGPHSEDWVALAVGNESDYIVLDREHILVLAESQE
jgi:hypothetical protein